LVASLNRPGGNATGAMNLAGGSVDAKAVQYLREVMPAAESLGFLVNPTGASPHSDAFAAARQLRWEFKLFEASTDDGLKTAFASMAKQKLGAVNFRSQGRVARRAERQVQITMSEVHRADQETTA